MQKKRCNLLFSSSKRANSTLWEIVKLIGAILFLVLVLSMSYAKARGEDVMSTYLAKDIALYLDSIMALPGDVVVYYPFPRFHNSVTISIGENNISIDGMGFQKSTFFFIPDKSISIEEYEYKINSLDYFELPIVKKGNKISFQPIDSSHSTIKLLPNVRLNTFDNDLSSKNIIFSYLDSDVLLHNYIESQCISLMENISPENVDSVSFGTNLDIINSIYPNLFIGIMIFEDSNYFDDTDTDYFVMYNDLPNVELYSRKLATIMYNNFMLASPFKNLRIGAESIVKINDVDFALSEVNSPSIVLFVSDSMVTTLGQKELSRIISNSIKEYYS